MIVVAAGGGVAFVGGVGFSKGAEGEQFAQKSKAIVEEWYPRTAELLSGTKEPPLPAKTVRLIFEPMKGVAHTLKADIHISAEWVTKKSPNDYGMVVHEL